VGVLVAKGTKAASVNTYVVESEEELNLTVVRVQDENSFNID
jgi:hypothetical protein